MLDGAKGLVADGLFSVWGFVWNGIYDGCYPVLLAIAIFSLTMYIAGYKNFGKAVPASVIIFALIRAIGRI